MRKLSVLMNGRILRLKANGQRRVAEELAVRMPHLTHLYPTGNPSGLKGHLWEQLVLPQMAKGCALWNPSTSAPVLYHNQVVTIHDVAYLDHPEYFTKSFAVWYSLIVRSLAGSARHLVTVSDFTRQRLIELLNVAPERVTTIHLGVTNAFFRQPTEVMSITLAEYELKDTVFFLGFAGSDPRKNTTGLLKAWIMSGLERSGARLLLFGRSGNEKVFSRQLSDENVPGVLRVGAVSDQVLASLYSAAKAMIFPSYYEGFGLPVVEASRCGCRVIAADRASLPEVSSPDTIFINPDHPEEIASAMKEVLLSNDSDDAIAARVEASTRFDWNRAALQYEKIFEDYLG